jgi:limonene-1,2-epoxide hydrolase
LVADGDNVMYEHSETWSFVTGETFVLPFVSVHRVSAGKVALWKDYWDFGAIANHAPSDWLDRLAAADTSWVFDATGLV